MSYAKNLRLWIRGILAAFITGFATAGLSALGVTAANLAGADVSFLGLKQLGVIGLSGGIVSLLAYLKQSPLPKYDDTNPPFLPRNGDGLRASSADKSWPQSTAEQDPSP